MELFKSMKKLLFKEQELALINIGDIIYIPDRSFYKDNDKVISLINYYKDKYLSLLSQKRTLISTELKFNNLQEDMIMNVDLLLHNIIDDNNYIYLAPEEIMIQMTKFKLYLLKINEMELEAISRLISLKELQKSNKISHRNKKCLNEEINNLSNSLMIFLAQKTAITKEIDTFLNMISINDNKIDNNLLKKRYDKVIFIATSINLNDTSSVNNIMGKIAFVEKQMEIYAYKNKEEIETLDLELETLNNIEKTNGNKEYLLNKIIFLEKKYLLFYEYGRNIISEEQMRNLYKVKFDILTSNIDIFRESPININDYGYSYYQTFIMNKIEKIVKGENLNIKETFKDNTKDAISIIINSFKNEYNEFDIDELLHNKLKLNLLLSFDKKDGFKEMLDNNTLLSTINIKDSNNFYEKRLLSEEHRYWDDKIPLKSYLSLISNDESSKEWSIYKLYKLLEEDILKSDVYELPEGIKHLDINLIPKDVLNKIREKAKEKILIMPSTLETINGNIFNNNYPKIILNDNLKIIDSDSFKKLDSEEITIPSAVQKISGNAFNKNKLKTIIFNDYKNSEILHNQDELINLLLPLILL